MVSRMRSVDHESEKHHAKMYMMKHTYICPCPSTSCINLFHEKLINHAISSATDNKYFTYFNFSFAVYMFRQGERNETHFESSLIRFKNLKETFYLSAVLRRNCPAACQLIQSSVCLLPLWELSGQKVLRI